MRRGGGPRRRERGRRRGIGRGARAGGGEHDSRRPNQQCSTFTGMILVFGVLYARAVPVRNLPAAAHAALL